MNIQGRKVLLRAIEREDLSQLQRWANDPEVQRLLGGWHFPTSQRDQQAWFESLNCQSLNQRFAVEAPDGTLVGTANLVAIDWKNRNAFHGVLIGERACRGKGYGVDTIMAMMRYAFDELGMQRLDTDIIEYNTPSLKAHVERCGWQVEGRKEQAYFRGGRYWDKFVLGITSARYSSVCAENGYWD